VKSLFYSLILLLLTFTAAAHAEESEPVPAASLPAESKFGAKYLDGAKDLALYALGLIGVTYKFGGNSPESGLDCSGLVHYVFRQVGGLVLPRNSRALSASGARVGEAELRPGDLVFYNTLRKPFSHVGIYLGEHRFIHAPSRGGEVQIVDMTETYWAKRYNGARRITF
jgi:cell wall-associated NlpC family hydrolase